MRLCNYYNRRLSLYCVIININITVIILILTSFVNESNHKHKIRRLPLHLPQILIDRKTQNVTSINNLLAEFMPLRLRNIASKLPVTVTADDFRSDPKLLTGNPLIDNYGETDVMLAGEMGRGVVFVGSEKDSADALQKHLNFNALASDIIPLNRMVPDSRMTGVSYADSDLTVDVIIPFYNEWPSTLLRTVYSVVNRTPRKHLHQILLVDDCSDNEVLGNPLQQYLRDYFPRDLVRVLRMRERVGLIRARMAGFSASSGDVIIFLDSHMEVNIDWVQPLLAQIQADRQTVPMAVLDYIDARTLQYNYNRDAFVRYGFDWRLFFFEVAAPERLSSDVSSVTEPVPGAIMVGAAFAIDRNYFEELGGYDVGMEIWGGENIELAWRVWLCGGRMLHVPCSHVGHIARAQPYKFPDGSHMTRLRNYKRAAEVWMGPYKKFLYENFPELKNVDVGELDDRLELRDRLRCQNFTWYLDNVWPQLTVYDRDVLAWGSAVNKKTQHCLDSHLFIDPLALYTDVCHYRLLTQGFSLTTGGVLRTTIHCVIVPTPVIGRRPSLRDCDVISCDKWRHAEDGSLVHKRTGLCLDEDLHGPVMTFCDVNSTSQKWRFTNKAPFL